MIIDYTTYSLKESNYNPIKTKKNKIIIGHTSSNNMNHVIGWKKRLNGKYKKTSHFTISLDGTIYKHFDLEFYSSLMDDENINKDSVYILVENEGWLETIKNKFINYFGDIYNRSDSVINKRIRRILWSRPYSNCRRYLAINIKLCRTALCRLSRNTKIFLAADAGYRNILATSLNDRLENIDRCLNIRQAWIRSNGCSSRTGRSGNCL